MKITSELGVAKGLAIRYLKAVNSYFSNLISLKWFTWVLKLY